MTVDPLPLLRRATLAGCGIILVTGWISAGADIYQPGLIGWSRALVVLLGVTLVGASYAGLTDSRLSQRLFVAYFHLFTLHAALALWQSQANPMVLAGVLLVVATISGLLGRVEYVRRYCAFAAVVLLVATNATPDPLILPSLASTYIVCFVALIALVIGTIERMKLENERNQQILSGLFEQSTDALLYFAADSEAVLRVNDRARDLFGHGDTSAMGATLIAAAARAAPDAEDRAQQPLARLIRNGSFECNMPIKVTGDREVWVEASFAPIAAGHERIILCRVADITERRRHTMQLRHTTRLLDRAQRLARLGGWEFFVHEDRWAVTDAGAEMLELPASADTQTVLSLFPPAERRRVRSAFAETLNGISFNIMADVRTLQSARPLKLQLVGEPIRGAQGIATIYGVFADITAQQRREDDLKDARDAAEQAAITRTQFLANMSHEIRTPMNGVIGMTSLLSQTTLDEAQQDYVQTIRSSGESLLFVLNEILDFSKLEAQQVELERQAFELEECVFEALAIVAPTLHDKPVELLCHVETGEQRCFVGDVQRLRQVLVNLLSNAAKFTAEGEIFVGVTVKPQGKDLRLDFEVRDTGIGIPSDTAARLFQPFTQADSSTTRRFGGTGLGLSICRGLVDLMGGQIWLDSEPGVGTSFHFCVLTQAAQNQPRVDVARLRGVRVLAVDDNATNRRIIGAQLSALGCSAVAVPSGQAALVEVQEQIELNAQPFAVVVTDMQMPDMDGVELIRRLHAQTPPDARPTPAVLLSSLDVRSQWREHFKAIAHKPIRSRDLAQALARALDLQTQVTQAPQPALPDFGHYAVLIAEDNLVNQRVAAAMLKKLGVEADIVGNGLEAITALATRAYDVVLMDVQMPELDGLEATRRIRADQRLPQPHIVAMTANATSGDRQNCMSAGMNDFVAKPVRLGDVQEALQRLGAARAAS
ncbi:MAG: response regulator [Pseudomonadota bacterium]